MSNKIKLLCEGWLEEGADPSAAGCLFYHDTAFVTQGKKRCYLMGAPMDEDGILLESVEGITLVESVDDLDLAETDLPGGRTAQLPKDAVWTVAGTFQLSDTENANKRLYPRKLWENLIGNKKSYVMEDIKARGMVGMLDHPEDGRTAGPGGALVMTHLDLRESGEVYGEAELLDTPNGLILQEYTAKKVRWGVSSRGTGRVDANGVVAENFRLLAWDAVMRPSTPGAYPKLKPATKKPEVTESPITETDCCEAEISEKIQQLTEIDINDLDAATWKVLFGQTQEVANGLSELDDDAKATDKVKAMQSWLTNQLQGLSESAEKLVQDAEEVLARELNENVEDQNENLLGTIKLLRTQLSDVTQEMSELQTKLEEAESDINAVREERDAHAEQLVEGEGREEVLQTRLELAESLLADTPDNSAVQDATRAAISESPELADSANFLEAQESPEDVTALAETLLSGIHRSSEKNEFLAEGKRSLNGHTPPVGIHMKNTKIAESSEKPLEEDSSPMSVGYAAQMVGGMTPPKNPTNED